MITFTWIKGLLTDKISGGFFPAERESVAKMNLLTLQAL